MEFTLRDFPIGSHWKRSEIHNILEGQVSLCAMKTSVIGGELNPADHEENMWVSLDQIMSMDLTPADVAIAKAIVEFT